MLITAHDRSLNRLDAAAERGPELCLCVGVVPQQEDSEAEDPLGAAWREQLLRERTLW